MIKAVFSKVLLNSSLQMNQNGRNLEYRPGRHDVTVQDEIRGVWSIVIASEMK